MADKDNMHEREDVHLEDVVEVGSRVSWSAILAGAVMAMAVGFVLALLGQAIGISVSDRASRDSLGLGGLIWTLISSVLALFIGGWITSQCVVGETKTEAVVHGIIMWGVTVAMVLWGTGSGIRSSFTAMMPVASIAGVTTEPGDRQSFQATSAAIVPQDNAQRAVEPRGVTGTRDANGNVADNRAYAGGATRSAAHADPAAARASWWTLANAVLSIVAALGGAFVGAGPTFRLLPLHVAHRPISARGAVPGGA